MKFLKISLALFCAINTVNTLAQSDTINTIPHYDLRPELLNRAEPPNIMIVFDNSGSMSSGLNGGGVGGAGNPNSRSFIARQAMQQVFNGLEGKVNLGLTVYDANFNGGGCGSHPDNHGSLRANIKFFDQAANTNIQNILNTENNTNSPGLIRSNGCTPIAATLQTVIDYVDPLRSLSDARNATGEAILPPPSLQCSITNAVILISDGQANALNPNIGCSNNNATTCSRDKVTELDNLSSNNGTSGLEDIGWDTYVIGFGGAPGLAANLNVIASGSIDENQQPRTFFPASDGADLVAVFSDILGNIFRRASSGSSASISTSSNQDAGFFVQSLYRPLINGIPHNGANPPIEVSSSAPNAIEEEAYWAGISRMLFVDPFGFVREDTNNNQTFDLANYGEDRAIRIEVDSQGNSVFRRLGITIQDGIPTEIENGQGPAMPLAELSALWELSSELNELPQDQIRLQRTGNFSDTDERRLILTNIDGQLRDFTFTTENTNPSNGSIISAIGSNPIRSSEIGYLGLENGQLVEAQNLIDWTRGFEDENNQVDGSDILRNRTIFTDTRDGTEGFVSFLLGDAIHSNPVVVGAPSEPFFELYGDTSYRTFQENNANRRSVAYIGTNDGMIHAVNSGIYDPVTRNFDEAGMTLGSEIWSFIPESLLPHLRFFASDTYTASNHIYGIDGPIIARDVRVGGTWRTYLFASTGYGGFNHQVDVNLDGSLTGPEDRLLRPSVVVLDVTNPEQPPIFIAEISNDNLGVTSVTPAVFHRNGQSFIAIGSGPSAGAPETSNEASDEMKGHFNSREGNVLIYRLNANSVSLVETVGGFGNGFIGDIAAIDLDLNLDNSGDPDYDTLYFGLNSGSGIDDDIDGKLMRITLNNNDAQELIDGYSFDNMPFVVRDRDERWIFAGTGRVNATGDFESSEDNKMFGILESLDEDLQVDTSTAFGESSLLDVSGVQVRVSGELTGGTLPAPQGQNDNGTIDHFLELQDEISLFYRGWVRELIDGSPSERVPGRATTPGSNTLTYIGFTPAESTETESVDGTTIPAGCSVVGVSRLITSAFSTGTAPWDEAFFRLNEAQGDNIIDDDEVVALDTLVKEANFFGINRGRGSNEDDRLTEPLVGSDGTTNEDPNNPTGAQTPTHPGVAVDDPACVEGETVTGICIGADGTNPNCETTLPGECGFGRKSFREIDFRYFR